MRESSVEVVKDGRYEPDVTDNPFCQLAMGAALGYAAASTKDEQTWWIVGTPFAAYRLLHAMGYFEVNARRHSTTAISVNQALQEARPSCCVSGRSRGLFNEAALLGAGFIGGYTYSKLK